MTEKRGRPFNYYGNDRGPPAFKKHKPNDSYSNGPRQNGTQYPPNHSGRTKDNVELERIARLPDPERCEPCKLAAAEMQTGLIALLDKLVAEEVGPGGDEDIVHHARQLHRLLSSRANSSLPSKSKRDLDDKRPDKTKDVVIPPYVDQKIKLAKDLPPLPPIAEPHFQEAVFTHSSFNSDSRAKGLNANTLNYERLEFLGDAYIEIIASRLLYSRFPQLEASQQSHFRESLVKNETLAHFSNAYAFGDRVKHGGHMGQSKAWSKIIADIFEAYVAAVVLSDPETGFTTAEKWLTELWAPQLLNYKEKMIENPRARDDIQKLLLGKGIKLDYREERPMVHENGVQKFFIALYLTGWGYENQWLGRGEGQNKAQACVDAARDALATSKDLIAKANKKKIEMYPPKPKEEEQSKEEVKRDEEGEKHRKEKGDDDTSMEKKKKKKSKKEKEKKHKSSDDDDSA